MMKDARREKLLVGVLLFWKSDGMARDYVLEEVRRRAKEMEMTPWNPPVVTGPEMLTSVLERAGHGE